MNDMNRTIKAEFNIYISDNLEKEVAEYYHEPVEDVTDEEIKEFIELSIEPATSHLACLQVEGGDTDGWFIQSISM